MIQKCRIFISTPQICYLLCTTLIFNKFSSTPTFLHQHMQSHVCLTDQHLSNWNLMVIFSPLNKYRQTFRKINNDMLLYMCNVYEPLMMITNWGIFAQMSTSTTLIFEISTKVWRQNKQAWMQELGSLRTKSPRNLTVVAGNGPCTWKIKFHFLTFGCARGLGYW